jgi:hypothetical protein
MNRNYSGALCRTSKAIAHQISLREIAPRVVTCPCTRLESSTLDEIGNHIQGDLRLVSGNHVASIVHLQKG